MLNGAIQTVQTTGINWESVGVITGVVTTVITAMITILTRTVGNQITTAIDKLRIEVIAKLETRITILEAVLLYNKKPDKDDRQ